MGFKGFMKGLWKGAQVAAPIVLPLVPGGGVAATIMNAVTMAETTGKAGPEKFETAMTALQVAAPLLVHQLETQFGVDLPDEAIDKYLRAQTQAIVDLMNAIGSLPKKTPA